MAYKFFMRIPIFILSVAATFMFMSCAQQEVAVCVENHSFHEGLRYADEVVAQSPFETVEISWSVALKLMEERNLAYRKALKSYRTAHAEVPMLTQVSSQLKESVGVSLQDILKPQALAKSFQDPIVGLPKQLGSIGALKDISHVMEQDVWDKAGDSVEARIQMRAEQVKLFSLLSQGEVIDRELERMEAEQQKPFPKNTPEDMPSLGGIKPNKPDPWLMCSFLSHVVHGGVSIDGKLQLPKCLKQALISQLRFPSEKDFISAETLSTLFVLSPLLMFSSKINLDFNLSKEEW